MLDLPYILSECEEINSLLYKPINSTQRIKYTCFDISPNYIILGSTSGSIYLFTREPCSFLQLIPLSEGAVSRVSMSPDEKTIALATIRGTVCLVSLKPSPRLTAVSTEHVYEQINCLCWNDSSSEVYIGDTVGKISVMVLSIFTVNGMFQAPACTLMNLDSSIVQMSFSSPLLLVSTLTRCYICDTVQEQYKQIGNKARNGLFGACFYTGYTDENKSTVVIQKEEKAVNRKGTFSFISENDSNMSEENYPKIFCARPGSRLWEVSANGIVIKTHQFKEALGVAPVMVYKLNTRGISCTKQAQTWSPQSINFSHLSVIAQKYLYSYTSTGLYVIDPISATVILWNDQFTNIILSEVIENKIYLMTSDNKFHCLTLYSIDSLILLLYNKKQYYECLNVCITYRDQLAKFVNDKEIDKVCELENEQTETTDLAALLLPLITLLQSSPSKHPVKLDSGIVIVNSGNTNVKQEEVYGCKSVSKMHSLSKYDEESYNTKEMNQAAEISVRNSTDIMNLEMDISKSTKAQTDMVEIPLNTEEDIEGRSEYDLEDLNCNKQTSDKNIMHKVQSDLKPIYAMVNSIKSSMTEKELEQIIVKINETISDIKESYEVLADLKSFMYEVIRTAELYYFNTFLDNTSLQLFCATNSNYIITQAARAFIDINTQYYTKCTCSYPYPIDQFTDPKFLEIGKLLVRKLERKECLHLCNKVPYMWREYLPIYIEQKHCLNEILRECLQTKDNVILSYLLPLLDVHQWNSVNIYLNEIKEGNCLFCAKSIIKVSEDNNSVINWSDVTREIMKRDGPDKAMTFLKQLETLVSNVSFDKSIFQSLIFTKILHHHGMKGTIDFNKDGPGASEYNAMCSTKIRDRLVEVMEKDLGRSISNHVIASGAHHWGMRYHPKSSTCPCCTLSLQTPVLLGNNGIAIFSCGHAYHVNCMIERKLTKCNLHS